MHEQRSRVFHECLRGSVPICDNAIYAATDHVGHLCVHLSSGAGVVADANVIGFAEPAKPMRENFGRGSAVEQLGNRLLTDIAWTGIAIFLPRK